MRKLLVLFILFFFVVFFDLGLLIFSNVGGGFALPILIAYSFIALVVGLMLLLKRYLGYAVADYIMLILASAPLFGILWQLRGAFIFW